MTALEQAKQLLQTHIQLNEQYEKIREQLHAEEKRVRPELNKLMEQMSFHELVDLFDGIEQDSQLKYEIFLTAKRKRERENAQ